MRLELIFIGKVWDFREIFSWLLGKSFWLIFFPANPQRAGRDILSRLMWLWTKCKLAILASAILGFPPPGKLSHIAANPVAAVVAFKKENLFVVCHKYSWPSESWACRLNWMYPLVLRQNALTVCKRNMAFFEVFGPAAPSGRARSVAARFEIFQRFFPPLVLVQSHSLLRRMPSFLVFRESAWMATLGFRPTWSSRARTG